MGAADSFEVFEDVVWGLRIRLRFDLLVLDKSLGLVDLFSLCTVRRALRLVVEGTMLLV